MSVLRQCGALVSRQLVNPQRLAVVRGSFGLLPATLKRVNVPAIEDDKPFNSRGHKNFGHEKEITPKFTKIFHLIVGSLFVISLMDWRK